MINYKDIEEKGFLLIENFLNQEEVNTLIKEYGVISQNKNYQFLDSTFVTEYLYDKLKVFMLEVVKNTNIVVDEVASGGYFDTDKVNYSWHQDHLPYYKWQDSYNSLNFWIPLIKPNKETSGVSVVNFKTLKEYDTDNVVANRLVGKGATHFSPNENNTIIRDDEYGKQITLNVNIENIKETPNIGTGDLLLMRQDVIHKTQDNCGPRLAVSVRCVNNNGIVYKNMFYNRCDKKTEMLNNNAQYNNHIEMFKTKEYCYVKDLLNVKKN